MAASADGAWALAADKFGDVSVAAIPAPGATPAPTPSPPVPAAAADGTPAAVAGAAAGPAKKAVQLLGHYNATITSLTLSPDGKQLVSTDRDHKVRVSVFPAEPLKVRRLVLGLGV